MTLAIPPRPEFDHDAITVRYPRIGWPTEMPTLLGLRGWFNTADNARGLYDDAMFLLTPSGIVGFNCNTDPSSGAPGRAELIGGVWRYKVGIHGLSKPVAQRYRALVQAAPVTVRRDGQAKKDTGWFGINIHRGGNTTTGSAGCQTIPPSQWAEFLTAVEAAMVAAGRTTIGYTLVE